MAPCNTRLRGGPPCLGEAWGVAELAVQAHSGLPADLSSPGSI